MSAAAPGTARPSGARLGIAVALAAITMFALLDVVSKVLGARMSVVQILWVRFVLFVPLALALAWRPGTAPRESAGCSARLGGGTRDGAPPKATAIDRPEDAIATRLRALRAGL